MEDMKVSADEEKAQTGFVVVEHSECLRHIKNFVNDDMKKLEQRIALLEKQLKLQKYSRLLYERFTNVVTAFILMISPVCFSFALDFFTRRSGYGYYGRESQMLKENMIRLLLAFSCMVGLPVFVTAVFEWRDVPLDDPINDEESHEQDEPKADEIEIEKEDDEGIKGDGDNAEDEEDKNSNENTEAEEQE